MLPERVPTGGLLILRDGEPGEPEVTLSPLRYYYQPQAEIEAVVQGAARDTACDFVRAGGTMAGIGRLQDARRIVEGGAGTQVRMELLASENRLPGEKRSGRLSKHQPEAVQGPA
ncbi:hypothetical protein RNZ50_04915 [Paracoccaceae bacterium Fryx2]|nr:hypothetical protein [Paracoccaceae bacterium Fryx2]